MALEVAKYQFSSWSRRGVSANILEKDTLGTADGVALERSSVPITVMLNDTQQITKNFNLIGPGDIIGVHEDMIVRPEPRNWLTNVEPNYLAYIEFYDEDFPWRYTPASAAAPTSLNTDGEKLRPWVMLLVLKESEFEATNRKSPLASIKITSKDAYPPFSELWLWAHTHISENIGAAHQNDLEKYLESLNTEINADPDKIYSRLISPRRLVADTAYHAFLVPAFETGRAAGLELPTAGIPAQKPAWNDATVELEVPIYYRWYFRTGVNEDFETLVKALEPRPMDPKVGIRDMDCSSPGFVQVDDLGKMIKDGMGKAIPVAPTKPPIIGLEGALKSPTTVSTIFPNPPTEVDFEKQVQRLVNLPEKVRLNLTEDPIVSVTFYGQNHARQKKEQLVLMDYQKNGWYNELNRDPRLRTPAGFGTRVVRTDKDKWIQKAWIQVQKVFEANKIIRNTKFVMQYSVLFTEKTFSKLPPTTLLSISSLVHSKIMGSPTTLRQQLNESRLPAIVFDGSFRRIMRPSGKIVKKWGGREVFNHGQMIAGLNEQTISAAPSRVFPTGLPTIDDLSGKIEPANYPDWVKWAIKNSAILLLVLLVVFFLIALFAGLLPLFAVVAAALAGAYLLARREQQKIDDAASLTDPKAEVTALAEAPPQPSFALKLDSDTAPAPAPAGTPGQDSPEAARFRTALINLNTRLAIDIPPPPITPRFDMANAYTKAAAAIHPYQSFPARLSARVRLPYDLSLQTPEEIVPAMAYPDFDDPMYAPLRDINKELMIPNLQLIPRNTISLLETNPKFIESYMVGLNHEMGRELLWQEYPTDMRGSYFRQFWEVKGIQNPVTPADGESLKDITQIHTWQSASFLGAHENRHTQDVAVGEHQVVLVIRGDLLKKYPNTVIYAQKAIAGAKADSDPVIRSEPTDMQFKTEYKFPMFRANIEPDIRFFGFDLTVTQAKGDKPTKDFTDKLGWFFILQEVPGEPRFGMEIKYLPDFDSDNKPLPITWDYLSWELFGDKPPAYISAKLPPAIPALTASEKNTYPWASNAANMAYILFQKPAMVAVHAKEMLDI